MIGRLAFALLALVFATQAGAQQYVPGLSRGFKSGFQFLGAGGFPASGAIADFDFKGNRYSGPTINVSNASGGYVDDSAGNWTLVPPNTLRRSDKGVLIEGAQTNSIRNNSMQGAVAGTPGTLPANWIVNNAAGLTTSVVGIGTINGVDYVDLRISGTTSGTTYGLGSEPSSQIAAASGQLWTASAFLAVVGGSTANITSIANRVRAYNSSQGGTEASSGTALSLTSTLKRFSESITLTNAGTAFIADQLLISTTVGVAIDITIRRGWPQLEQWSTSVTTVGGASSPIRTTGTAATRAADVVTATLGSALSAMTVAGVVQPGVSTLSGGIMRLGTASDRVDIRSGSATPTIFQVQPVVGGSAQTQLNAAANTLAPLVRTGFAYAGTTGDQAASIAGAAVVANAPTSLPTVSALVIGGGGSQFNGYIERLAVYPYRAANSNLQQMSTLANWGG